MTTRTDKGSAASSQHRINLREGWGHPLAAGGCFAEQGPTLPQRNCSPLWVSRPAMPSLFARRVNGTRSRRLNGSAASSQHRINLREGWGHPLAAGGCFAEQGPPTLPQFTRLFLSCWIGYEFKVDSELAGIKVCWQWREASRSANRAFRRLIKKEISR